MDTFVALHLNGTEVQDHFFLDELRAAKEAKLLSNQELREENWRKFLFTFWVIFGVYLLASFVWIVFSIYYYRRQKSVCKQRESEYSLTKLLERQRLLHLYNNVSVNCENMDDANQGASETN
ncbi:hypothetical protein L596_003000 [Steinernema carpocapsae]|uniref:Uncharacterized protein n=1 Tax=Steinernema carpocapsae TaxID=34508 RepID=A0A4U8URB3_STECR|nr:hypothetical protein L596_003000 [Steinernema carpocapsae]